MGSLVRVPANLSVSQCQGYIRVIAVSAAAVTETAVVINGR